MNIKNAAETAQIFRFMDDYWDFCNKTLTF